MFFVGCFRCGHGCEHVLDLVGARVRVRVVVVCVHALCVVVLSWRAGEDCGRVLCGEAGLACDKMYFKIAERPGDDGGERGVR